MKRLVLFTCALLAASGTRLAAQEDDETERFFAIPLVRDTRELAAVADEHLRAERFPEAIASLQRILEDHAHEVLPAQKKEPGQSATYQGAAEWAMARLFELPEAARAEYRARYEPRAAEALLHARLAPSRGNLVAITRRWPLAPAAVRAWWALGDLELEGGQAEAAELAWRQALALARELGLATQAPAPARLAWLKEREAARANTPRLQPGLPRADAQAWTRALDLTPFVQGKPNPVRNLQPVVANGLVLVGTTLCLYAIDAFTGELRWQAGPPSGWAALAQSARNALYDGINWDQVLLAPAAGDGVALAVMQQPFTEYKTADWQNIEIMRSIPERRLHAYDLGSGRELWNHAPRLTTDGLLQEWDGEGSYAQRMMVAGSPVVAGARVLVPCYRMQGRIDYHVACYELASGELLWSTLVVSGQRERNMFGRSVKEFSASPLVVAGNRVLAQTELGTLAALDLFSGRILWQTAYPQIPLPRTKNYGPPTRPLTWTLLAPPVLVGDVVVSAPSDSMEILAVRLANGAKLWAYRGEQLQELDRETAMLSFNHLVGADADTLYLSGAKLSALQKPGGIGTTGYFVTRWKQKLDRSDSAPRALLAGDAIIAPNEKRRAVYDRRTGAEAPTLSGGWGSGEAGSLCLWDGALFSLSAQGLLSGYFDWQGQLERARRLADSSSDEAPLRTAAELYLRHGSMQLADGDAQGARATLAEARTLFTRLRQHSARPDVRSELACVRALAESLARLLREDEALAVLSGARPLAAVPKDLAELLFLEERILRARGGAQRIARLSEIEACWGEQPLPGEVRAESMRRWLADASAGSASEPESDALPTVLWVALERADERVRAGELAAALEDLHLALRHARGLALARGVPLGNLVNERIARLLALPGGEAAYAPLEAEAAELLAEERQDEATLAEVSERYPHSRAAERALGLLIERAADARDAPTVARLVRAALSRGGLTPEREAAFLLVLAHTLGEQGNGAFERSLVAALARAFPTQVSALAAHAGRTLATLAAESAEDTFEAPPAPVLFDSGVVSAGQPLQVEASFLGALRPADAAPESAPHELHLYATRTQLQAFTSVSPGAPLWTRALDLGNPPCAFAPGRVVLGTRAGLVCLDERGRELWAHATEDDPPVELAHSGGVLVALLRSERVLALDALLGLPLWERTLEVDDNWTGPVVGGGHAVFFSQLHKLPPRALVLDLFRGRVTADIRLSGYDSKPALARSAWIAEERLVAPAFGVRPAQLSAFALAGGQRAWTIEFGVDEELHAVAHTQGKAFPITLVPTFGPAAGYGAVYELDARTGTVRKVVPLQAGERVMGLGAQLSEELPAPYLFTHVHSEKEHSIPIRALHLPYGVQWTWALPIGPQEIYDGRALPMPAVSSDCVAIAYSTRRTGGAPGSEATLVFVDKRAGKKVDTLTLDAAFAQTSQLELRGLGAALFVLGKGSTPRGACLDILEKLR